MPLRYNTLDNGDMKINAATTFSDAFNSLFTPTRFPSFDSVLIQCISLVKSENPNVTTGAISNVKGAWYQWLLALAWQYFASAKSSHLRLIKLPNKKVCKWHRLYEQPITELVDDLEAKIAASSISLETSNPDFVLIHFEDLQTVNSVGTVTEETLAEIDNEHASYIGKVKYGRMPAFLSIKTSLRPDRRLQTQFEATMIKAIQAYFATRRWDIQTLSSKFYVVVNSVPSQSDHESLSALAAHSLVTPLVKPQKLVDLLIQVNDFNTAESLFIQF